jgi:hypothetical protein
VFFAALPDFLDVLLHTIYIEIKTPLPGGEFSLSEWIGYGREVYRFLTNYFSNI